MTLRVILAASGGFAAVVLIQYGWPKQIVAIIAFLPLIVAEVFGLTRGPYEKSAHEIMHEPSGTEDSKGLRSQ
jgi:hypothetical protein